MPGYIRCPEFRLKILVEGLCIDHPQMIILTTQNVPFTKNADNLPKKTARNADKLTN